MKVAAVSISLFAIPSILPLKLYGQSVPKPSPNPVEVWCRGDDELKRN
jgi:hypothetical protein